MDFYNAAETRRLLEAHGFSFSKSLGQNFLIDQNIPEKIVRLSGIDKSFTVLEIGPGLGALTINLCAAAGHVISVELDKRIIPLLEDTLAGFDNYTVVNGDILKLDIPEILTAHCAKNARYAVCANLPYNITTPVLTRFIESAKFETITVMIQREVAHRLCAAPGTPDYGAFTVFINYHTTPRLLFDVPPECFMPRPKVFSSVVTMTTKTEREYNPISEQLFFRTVRASFAQRRKTLLNALHASFGGDLSKEELSELITACGFDTRVRGETLGMPEFVKLSDAIAAALNH